LIFQISDKFCNHKNNTQQGKPYPYVIDVHISRLREKIDKPSSKATGYENGITGFTIFRPKIGCKNVFLFVKTEGDY